MTGSGFFRLVQVCTGHTKSQDDEAPPPPNALAISTAAAVRGLWRWGLRGGNGCSGGGGTVGNAFPNPPTAMDGRMPVSNNAVKTNGGCPRSDGEDTKNASTCFHVTNTHFPKPLRAHIQAATTTSGHTKSQVRGVLGRTAVQQQPVFVRQQRLECGGGRGGDPQAHRRRTVL